MKTTRRLEPQAVIIQRYLKNTVLTVILMTKNSEMTAIIFTIHSPSLIIFTFSFLQNMQQSSTRCNPTIETNVTSANLYFTHSSLHYKGNYLSQAYMQPYA